MPGPRVIVALDFPDSESAEVFLRRIDPARCRIKVGLELFCAAGPDFVRRLVERGYDVFLDLKYHDIPTTVARACAQAAALGAWMVNVHCLGGGAMLAAAREAIDRSTRRPLLVGVTLLTSHDADILKQTGIDPDVNRQVERLAGLAHAAGLDGVVCSAAEAKRLRRLFGDSFVLVTPGIRQDGDAHDDQRRTRTPAEAIADGADYIVVGRPVTRAADPAAVLDAILRQIPAP